MNKLFSLAALFTLCASANSAYASSSVCDRSKPMKYAIEAYFKKKCISISDLDLASIEKLEVAYGSVEILPTDFEGVNNPKLRLSLETDRDSINPQAMSSLRNRKISTIFVTAKNITQLEKGTFSNLQMDSFRADLGSLKTSGPLFVDSSFRYLTIHIDGGDVQGDGVFSELSTESLEVVINSSKSQSLIFSSKQFSSSKIDEAWFRSVNIGENQILSISKDAFQGAELGSIKFNLQGWRTIIEQDALPASLKEFYYVGEDLNCPTGCFSPNTSLDNVSIDIDGKGFGSKPFLHSSNVKNLYLKLHEPESDPDFLTDLEADHFELDNRSKTFSLRQAKAIRSLALHEAGSMELVHGPATDNYLEELEILGCSIYANESVQLGSFSSFKKLKKLSIGDEYYSVLYSMVTNGILTPQEYKNIISSNSVEQIIFGEEIKPASYLLWLENSAYPKLQKLDIAVAAYKEIVDFPRLYNLLKNLSLPELNLSVELRDEPSVILSEISKVTQLGWLGGLQKLKTNHLSIKYPDAYNIGDSFVIDDDIHNTNKLSILVSTYRYNASGSYGPENSDELKKFTELKANDLKKNIGKEISYSSSWETKFDGADIRMEFEFK